MLQTFYENFGFLGALLISAAMFIFFIFWMAGIAGIALPEDGGQVKNNRVQIVVAILIPIYPIIWLWTDMYKQHKFMLQNDENQESKSP